MAKKKKLFPFRFRWFSAPSTPQTSPIIPPKDESKSQEQADKTILIKGSPEKTPARAYTQDIPIADSQQETPSHSLQPEKPFSDTNALASISSSSAPQSQPPGQPEKEKMAVTQQEPQPVTSPLRTIPKSQEPNQPEISPHVSEPITKESPFTTSSKPQDHTQPGTSSHDSLVFESMPQSKESPSKTTPKSQEIIQSESSSHVSEPVPYMESPLRASLESQDLTQQETSSHVSESVPQPKTESHVFESKLQSKESPSKTIPKSQEIIQLKTPPHVSESVPHMKESPFRSIPESQDLTQPETSSHVSESVPKPKIESPVLESKPQSKESPPKTMLKSQEITQLKTPPHVSESVPHMESPFRSIPESQDLTQPETSFHVFESVPQPEAKPRVFESKPKSKESPSKTIPKPQEITQLNTSPHVSESIAHMESPFKSTPISQDVTQPETSPQSHVSDSVPHPKTESHVFESRLQAKESPSKTIPKSQEITKSQTPSYVHESGPQLKESPSKTSPKSKEKTQLRISSHEALQKTQVKESSLKTSPRVSEPMPQQKMSPLKIVSMPEEPIQTKISPQHKRISSASGTQASHSSSMVIRAKRTKQDTQESTESKVMSAYNYTGKDAKSSIYLLTKNVPTPSHQDDISPTTEKTPLKEGIIEDISKFVKKLAMGQPADTTEDKSISAITLAGENRGATMHMGLESAKKEGSVHIHQAYRMDSPESHEATTESDREEGFGNSSIEPDEVGNAYVNSNIQSVNNSLMFQGSVIEKDPGVQLILPQRPAEAIQSDDEDSKG